MNRIDLSSIVNLGKNSPLLLALDTSGCKEGTFMTPKSPLLIELRLLAQISEACRDRTCTLSNQKFRKQIYMVSLTMFLLYAIDQHSGCFLSFPIGGLDDRSKRWYHIPGNGQPIKSNNGKLVGYPNSSLV